MSNDKALAIIPATFTEIQSMSEALAKSGLLPEALKGKPSDIAFSILCGQELGLAPVASIRGIHIIAGKPTLAADTMMGLVLASGLCEYFVQTESSNTSATFETKRKGAPIPQKVTWTLDDAKRAGLYPTKETWRCFTRQLLAARAKAELARSAYPDVLAGIYDPDELGSESTPVRVESTTTPAYKPPEDVIDVDFTDVPSTPVSPFSTILEKLIADINAATSKEALDALLPRWRDLPNPAAKKERLTAQDALKARTLVVEKLPDVVAAIVTDLLEPAGAKDANA